MKALLTTLAAGLVVTTLAFPTLALADQDSDGIEDSDDRCVSVAGHEDHFGCPHPVRVTTKITRPPKRVTERVKDWSPWSEPSPAQVIAIAASEQKRWGGPSIVGLLTCESTLNWAATNGQYQGLAQFGPIWHSMWPGTPRGVKFVESRVKVKPVMRHTLWSNDRWTHRRIGKVKQRQKIIRSGRLPRNATPFHGYAAIRVTQRAFAGVGPTTSWACGV
jgi:hypothetical protein